MRSRLTFCIALTYIVGCGSTPPPPAVDAPTGTVTLEVPSGETVQTVLIPNVADGTTLEAVMKSVDEIPITLHGSGNTAFVAAIGDTETNATEGWTFKVDGKWAETGVGTTVLHPPTTVTWAFGNWEQDSSE